MQIEVGSLVAHTQFGAAWLFRVTHETPKRWHVELVERNGATWARNPTSGHTSRYFDKGLRHLILVRDMDHFEAIKVAHLILTETVAAAKEVYDAACEAARAKYAEQIA